MTELRIALVTGGNRGIGFGVCRELGKQGYHVLLGARNEAKGKAAADTLKQEGLTVEAVPLDVTDAESIARLKADIEQRFGRLDVLVNNAGVMPESADLANAAVMKIPVDTVRSALETNLYGPLLLIQTFVPLMRLKKYGRVVNVSSGMGQLCDMNGGFASYRFSKVALNALSRIAAAEVPKKNNVLINSVCPGWVQTDMGGANATRAVEEGAASVVWAATLPDGGPTGGFFRDGKELPW